MRSISIRLATTADAGLLAELGERTIRDTFPGGDESDTDAFVAANFGRDILAAELLAAGERQLRWVGKLGADRGAGVGNARYACTSNPGGALGSMSRGMRDWIAPREAAPLRASLDAAVDVRRNPA